MEANRLSPQEQRENSDPREAAMAIPVPVYIVVACTIVFGILYILSDSQPLPGPFGDQRTPADLMPKAAAATTKAGAAPLADGPALYAARCAACHQANGAGLPGVFPPLAGSEWVIGKGEVAAMILLHGISGTLTVKGSAYNGAMPAFKDQLNDGEIAALATHIRSQWGNQAAAVAPEVVAAARTETASRTAPWNGDTELEPLK